MLLALDLLFGRCVTHFPALPNVVGTARDCWPLRPSYTCFTGGNRASSLVPSPGSVHFCFLPSAHLQVEAAVLYQQSVGLCRRGRRVNVKLNMVVKWTATDVTCQLPPFQMIQQLLVWLHRVTVSPHRKWTNWFWSECDQTACITRFHLIVVVGSSMTSMWYWYLWRLKVANFGKLVWQQTLMKCRNADVQWKAHRLVPIGRRGLSRTRECNLNNNDQWS